MFGAIYNSGSKERLRSGEMNEVRDFGRNTPFIIDKSRGKNIIKGTEWVNLSGRSLEEIWHLFPRDLVAERVVLLPDFSPSGDELPVGSAVVVDKYLVPDWRKYVLSDVGCGMQVLQAPEYTWEGFEDKNTKQYTWDGIASILKSNKGELGDLGHGNHFLDAAIDLDEPEDSKQLYFVIHTGSRAQTKRVRERWADQEKFNPDEFDKIFQEVMNWARTNRDTIRKVLESMYGRFEFVLDIPHNFFTQDADRAYLYKGAVSLKPGEKTIIPSSMVGDMIIVEAKENITTIGSVMSHGTGRVKSRGESKEEQGYDFSALRRKVYIPDLIPNSSFANERPESYRTLDEVLRIINPFVEIKKTLTPIAYIGQL